jgi:hypothetical protein
MPAENNFIEKLRNLIEESVSWGRSDDWTNQDFVALSEKIQDKTGAAVSHVTLKRIWGKVKYQSLPNTHTLNTLAQFVGYENWRSFVSAQTGDQGTVPDPSPVPRQVISSRAINLRKVALYIIGILATGMTVAFLVGRNNGVDPADFSFSSKKVISKGVPNSVVFDLDARKAPGDSVIIQQSWNKRLRATIPKDQRQHTSIYYFPDWFRAKLIVGDKVVKEHDLFITSDGWLPLVAHKPVPVYFDKEDAIHDGKMSLSADQIRSRNISFHPEAPLVVYSNVRDYGPVFTDDFIFETSLKNDFREGSSACQKTNVYLLCECDGTAVGIPLCSKGCVSGVDLIFPGFYAQGKQKDLSTFGVSFENFVKLRIESADGAVKVFIDERLAYAHNEPVVRAKIIGIDIVFEGTGTVEYVKLANDSVTFEDNF